MFVSFKYNYIFCLCIFIKLLVTIKVSLCILIAISFIDGKFIVGDSSKVREKEPWEKYIIQNIKSKRLIYYNQLTKEIYLSAYRSKQCGFNAYLNGQRKLRWVIECNIEKLEQVVAI